MKVEKMDVFVSNDGMKWFDEETCRNYESECINQYDDIICKMNVMKSITLPRLQKRVDALEASLKKALASTEYKSRIERLDTLGWSYRNLAMAIKQYKTEQRRYACLKDSMRSISKSFGIRRSKTSVKVSKNEH